MSSRDASNGQEISQAQSSASGPERFESGIPRLDHILPPPRLIETAEMVGLPLRRFVDEGKIEIRWQAPLERHLNSLAEQMLEEFHYSSDQRRRLFVDSLEGFKAASIYPRRMRLFLAVLVNQLRTSDISTIFASELPLVANELDDATRVGGPIDETGMASIAESAVWLRNRNRYSRFSR